MNEQKHNNTSSLRTFKDIFLILAAVVSASFGINGFLLSSHFIDGGVTGIHNTKGKAVMEGMEKKT